MEPVDFNKAPQGATHFLRYDSGYVVWCCVIEDGPNGLPIVNEWDSFNECWMPAIYGVEHYYSIGMEWIEKPTPAPQATAHPEAPKGATHRYDHACTTAWYREVDGKLFVWRDGRWHAGVSKSIPELAESCMLGKLTSLVEEEAEPAEDDLSELGGAVFGVMMRAVGYQRLRDACRVMRDQPDDCKTEAVDALYKLSRELLIQRDALPGNLSSKALVAASSVKLLRNEPHMFSANELAELHQLCDAELTKRDAAVCGGQKYLDAHWFERGELPPVGAECEAFAEGVKAEKCKIIAYHNQQVAVQWSHFNDGGLDVLSLPGWSFRPINSDRDVLMDAIVSQGFLSKDGGVCGQIADVILAAGFKRDGGAA